MLSLVQESEGFIVSSQKYVMFYCKVFQNGDTNLKYNGASAKEEEILQEEETRPCLSSAAASRQVSEVSS